MDKVGVVGKDKYLDFLREMFDKKIDWFHFHEFKNEEIKKIDKDIQKAMQNILYQEEKINIE